VRVGAGLHCIGHHERVLHLSCPLYRACIDANRCTSQHSDIRRPLDGLRNAHRVRTEWTLATLALG
jgi:hypothetical protein